MVDYLFGCSGWSYKAWIGPFYPVGSEPKEFLKFYSKAFRTVEIDSTFYSIPGKETVRRWVENTPDDFVFSPKVPRSITHDNRLLNVELLMEKFIDVIGDLGHKMGMILVQLPPSFSFQEGFERLGDFLDLLPEKFEFAVEFRNETWFNEDLYELLRGRKITMAWTEVPMTSNPGILTSDSVYLRLVGDRTIREENFGTIRRNRDGEMKMWSNRLTLAGDDIKKAYVYSNNHFQGFGPGTVNLFRKAMGMDEISFNELRRPGNNQTTLF